MAFRALQDEIAKHFVGQETLVEDVLAAYFAPGHILLEGVPGLGKTLLSRTLAESLQLSYERIQCTPDLIPADILGRMTLQETEHGRQEPVNRQGPVVSHFVLVDEVNRATPKTQSALLEAMQERQITIGTKVIPLPGRRTKAMTIPEQSHKTLQWPAVSTKARCLWICTFLLSALKRPAIPTRVCSGH